VNRLLQPLPLGTATAKNRVMFGPIVTNLGDDERRLTTRHTAFYARRARGGCGVIVVEGASAHDSDWPYERAPLATHCGTGWHEIAAACHAHGALVIASLDHTGGQGSSAYSQRELWAPSRVPEVNSREVPKWMEADDIAAVVDGFADAAARAAAAGCDGVEVNAGQHSLVRQFLSGLTNHRDDEWGADRLRFATQVLTAVRAATPAGVVGLRLSCDELAPWAGITPDTAVDVARTLAELVDYLVVVRGSIYSVEKTRADAHEPEGYNLDLCRTITSVVDVPVFLQGSVVDPAMAERAIEDGTADGVEMTRAQLADPDLVGKIAAGDASNARPCIRCNQTCQVRDARNPIITCVGEPTTGRETEDPDWYVPAATQRTVRVIGGGIAGLEVARVASRRGHRVEVVERRGQLGGVAAISGPGRPLVRWLIDQCTHLGVTLTTGIHDPALNAPDVTVQATGSQPGRRTFDVVGNALVLDVVDVAEGIAALPDGPIALHDPIGGPIAVALAEALGDRAILVTPDQIAGNELSRTGDLAPANVRLQQRGVHIERRAVLRAVHEGSIEIEDRFSGARRRLDAAALVDCGFRRPTDPIVGAGIQIGDCVAPRSIHEAVLDGRRAALAIDSL
jgi:mycofactocin system FadH/OYE family oxidoreductase 1